MIDSGWLNIGSFVFGLIAWILPVGKLLRNNKQGNQKWFTFSVMSMSACAVSLCFQIIEIYYLVTIEDWSALSDTIGFVTFAATVLLIVTIILNTITLMVYRDKKQST
ncbi:hypothetical protein RWE15_05150 [Virgibacillus halophilus]|uniref:Cytochrome c oxidase subunit 4 n=1 Tax=Tigheibacillus halophilus TaxID=361280 RepID=A0ABU5C3R9_9BACI|nr:hypothetical protein [Virgibacillus halophilus]